MQEKKMKLFMPVTKSKSGEFVGILSDTSMDRDSEFMSKELLEDWARSNKSLKALANHKNSMENWVGGWTAFKTIKKGRNTALVARPWFFSEKANPLAAQIKAQVEEALANGDAPGLSIGCIPHKAEQKEIEGKSYTVYTKAELLETSWVAIPANRNATFGHIAKKFDFDVEKNIEVETDEISKEVEETNKMVEETIVKDSEVEDQVPSVESEAKQEASEEVSEEVVEEKPAEEKVDEEESKEEVAEEEESKEEETKEEVAEEKEGQEVVEESKSAELEALEKENHALKKKLEKYEKQTAVLKAKVDGPIINKKDVEVKESKPLTVERMIELNVRK